MFSRATTTRTTIAAATLAAAGLLAAGCSSLSGGGDSTQPSLSTSGSATPSATSSSVTSSPTGDTPTSSTSSDAGGSGGSAHGGQCETANLKATAGHGNAAAGNHYVPLTFTNTGSGTCTMSGWPGVSYVNAPKGGPVGKPAHRTGDDGGAVTLAPGESAVAKVDEVQVRNYDPNACGLTGVKGLRVYPPNNTASLFVPLSNAHACSGTGIPGEQLEVKPVTPS